MNTDLYKYTLRLADTALILSHRLCEYTSKGPFLEEDLASMNTGLDYIGQAEALLKYAAKQNGTVDADQLAFAREEDEYANFHLVEFPNQDFGYLITRQFFMDVFSFYNFQLLKESKDETLAALAAKSLKEVTYHLKRSSEWMIRLGDGTAESHDRIQGCVNHLWMYVDEMFDEDEVNTNLLKENIATDLSEVKKKWMKKVSEVFEIATLTKPEQPKYSLVYGKDGGHTEYMGFLLTEMQFLKNRFPQDTW